MRQFETGATRDTDENKPDYEGYFSPYALESFGAYMLKHQKQADGQMRSSDNWKKGIPTSAYRKSLYRHHLDFQKFAAEGRTDEAIEMANAILFNVMGWLHEMLKPGKAVAGAMDPYFDHYHGPIHPDMPGMDPSLSKSEVGRMIDKAKHNERTARRSGEVVWPDDGGNFGKVRHDEKVRKFGMDPEAPCHEYEGC